MFKKYINPLFKSRIIFSSEERPSKVANTKYDGEINVIYASMGNGSKLEAFYKSLPEECKKSIIIDDSEIA